MQNMFWKTLDHCQFNFVLFDYYYIISAYVFDVSPEILQLSATITICVSKK